jgi:hypothetical protein
VLNHLLYCPRFIKSQPSSFKKSSINFLAIFGFSVTYFWVCLQDVRRYSSSLSRHIIRTLICRNLFLHDFRKLCVYRCLPWKPDQLELIQNWYKLSTDIDNLHRLTRPYGCWYSFPLLISVAMNSVVYRVSQDGLANLQTLL